MIDVEVAYIGYLTAYHYRDPVILAVSDSKEKVKYYLKEIRGLDKSQYMIKEAIIGWDALYALYEDYFLEEYGIADIHYLTNRDIEYLNNEIYTTIHSIEELRSQLKNYTDLIKTVKKLAHTSDTLMNAVHTIDVHLQSLKNIRKISKSIILKSDIMNKNILEYLRVVGYIQEDRELINQFYNKMWDERS